MKVKIELTKADVQKIIQEKLSQILNVDIDHLRIRIKTKSTQNYKAEWEEAEFRVEYEEFQ